MGDLELDALRRAYKASRFLQLAIGRAARLAFVLVAFWIAAAALADEPLPAAPVETCTLEQQRSGEECLMCGTTSGDPAKCQKRLSPRGYQRRCRGNGDDVWMEAWCRPLGGKPTPTPRAAPAPFGY